MQVVVVDYDGGPTQGDAWITLTMHRDPAALLTLQRVVWCKSLVPNDQQPHELALDCTGRNLLHLELYPGSGGGEQNAAVVKEPPPPPEPVSEAEGEAPSASPPPPPNTFYIDPARIGGWDARHQWLIIVEMSQRDGVPYREVVRFNALHPATTTTTTTIITTGSAVPGAGETSTAASAGPTTTTTTTDGPLVVAEMAEHAWRAALAVFCVGVAAIALVTGVVLYLRSPTSAATRGLARQRVEAIAQAYGGSRAYQFEGEQAEEEIEMRDFSAADKEDERRLHKEDMDILENMK